LLDIFNDRVWYGTVQYGTVQYSTSSTAIMTIIVIEITNAKAQIIYHP
jgi:hypothetical protein